MNKRTSRTLDVNIEKRVIHGLVDDFLRPLVALPVEHHGHAATLHDGSDISEVQIYQAWNCDRLDYSLDYLSNQLIHDAEGLFEGEIGNELEKPVIVQYEDRIRSAPKKVETLQSTLHPHLPLDGEWRGDDRNDESTDPLGLRCHHGRYACPSPPSEARSHEYQIRPIHDLGNHAPASLSGLAAHMGVAPCSETSCDVSSNE